MIHYFIGNSTIFFLPIESQASVYMRAYSLAEEIKEFQSASS